MKQVLDFMKGVVGSVIGFAGNAIGSVFSPGGDSPKIGGTHAEAMFRAGFKELTQILPATAESVQPVEEIGLAGNALPQEVYQDRHEVEPNINQNLEMQM
ncbi:hypothetical protein KOR34_01000 [Posidoniimonas corsicana]|uniref:Uncharacterized protein n=1 Tax=Posidoniimonas corsicana TaxID=1938618 RepID=A0A5C5VBW3_9BACT|nr:hypothetical protein [Posidoniimonas corsicana]TWT35212.1 hypothetical protein KOR34_01000 [Posidoniimonas corsicana]